MNWTYLRFTWPQIGSALVLLLAVSVAQAQTEGPHPDEIPVPRIQTINVANVIELRLAIGGADPGDRIVVADGVYDVEEALRVTCAGTPEAPIVIEAETIGGVEIGGAAGFLLEAPAAYVVIQGFNFTHEAGEMKVGEGVHHCRITRNIFELKVADKGRYLSVIGDDIEIDYNTFRNKDTEGQMIHVQGPGQRGMAQRTWIHHNYFHDFRNSRRNNSSALHIGHSARSLTSANAVVEYNLFLNCRGENEGAICNKSCDNIYRFNTIGEGSTELSLRHGNNCLVYGNYFISSTGLRFFGDEHRIFSNYFERCRPAIAIGNGGANIPPAALTSHDRPDGVHVVFNTLVDNERNVQMSGRRGGLGADRLVFAKNLIYGGNSAVSIDGPLPDATWADNAVGKNEGGHGDIPEGGYRTVEIDVSESEGLGAIIAAGIGVLDTEKAPYDYVSVDIQGFARRSNTWIGADQISEGIVKNRVLTPADVGPNVARKDRPLLSAPGEIAR